MQSMEVELQTGMVGTIHEKAIYYITPKESGSDEIYECYFGSNTRSYKDVNAIIYKVEYTKKEVLAILKRSIWNVIETFGD